VRFAFTLALVAAGAGGLGCQPEELAFAEAWLIDDDAEVIGGPLASARRGDFFLGNGRVRFAIQRPGRAIALCPHGGNIIDADLWRPEGGHDALGEICTLLDVAGTMGTESLGVERDGSDGGEAVVRASGPYAVSDYINAASGFSEVFPGLFPIDADRIAPLDIAVDYALAPGASHLEMRVALTNTGQAEEAVIPGYLLHPGVVRPFLPEMGGFETQDLGPVQAMMFEGNGVAYAFAPLPASDEPSLAINIAGTVGFLPHTDASSIIGYPEAAPVKLAPGETHETRMALAVGADIAEVAAVIRSLGVERGPETAIVGVLTEEGSGEPIPDAAIVALDPERDDIPFALARTDEDGAYRLVVPAGPVSLIAGHPGWPYAGGGVDPVPVDLEAPSGGLLVRDLTLPQTGRLEVQVRDETGEPIPARVLVLGVDPSPLLHRLESAHLDPLAPGVVAQHDLAHGTLHAPLEPGAYDVVVVRGMEYTLHREPVAVEAGATVTVDATLVRVVDTTGYLSGDFHYHGARGPDTAMRNTDRVVNAAADGLEVMVATDHAYVTDYQPIIEATGLTERIATISGQEVTTFDYGHFNLFPLPIDPEHPSNGAIDWVGRSPAEIMALGTAGDEPRVVQVNHPRRIPTDVGFQNYFEVIDLRFDEQGWYLGPDTVDPSTVRLDPDAVMFAEDFTALEVMTWTNVQGLSDWFNLLGGGMRVTATANTDTHTLRVEASGWPRNFVRVGADDPSALDEGAFVEAVNAGRVTCSFGPFVTVRATGRTSGNTASEGEDLSAPGEAIDLAVRVQAPTWIGFDTIDLYQDGLLLERREVAPAEVPVGSASRFDHTETFTVTPANDAWFVAVVSGSSALFPGVPYNTTHRSAVTLERLRADDVEQPLTPFAFANPVFVDVDGDGGFTPQFNVVAPDWQHYRFESRLDPY